MKFFTNKNLIQKLIIIFVCIFVLEFCIATPRTYAKGGRLFAPIKLFVTAIGDIMASTVQLLITGKWIPAVQDDTGDLGKDVSDDVKTFWKKKIDFPIIQISPELIFANKIELLNIDFIGGSNSNKEYIIEDDKHVGNDLRVIIASWYVTLRTLATVGSLSVLLYIGIRIIISSTAGGKSKYKQMLTDWVIAFCILIFMHYIMAATINIVNRIDELLSGATHVTDGIELRAKYGNVTFNPQKAYTTAADEEFENATGHAFISNDEIMQNINVSFYDNEDAKEKKENSLYNVRNYNVSIGKESGFLGIPKSKNVPLLSFEHDEGEGWVTNKFTVNEEYINAHPGEIGGTLTIRLNEENGSIANGSVTVEPANCTVFLNIEDINRNLNNGENVSVGMVTPSIGQSKYTDLRLVTFPGSDKTALISKYSETGRIKNTILHKLCKTICKCR